MKQSFTAILVAIVLSSCVSTRARVNTLLTNGVRIDTLNLMSTMIGPIWQPVLPLLDAAPFNEKTNKIADQIMDEEQKIINDYQTILVRHLREKLPPVIVTGAEFTSQEASKYKVNNGIQIDNNNFPVVFFSEGDLNTVDFGKGKNVNEMFKNNEVLKKSIASLAAQLNIKTVLISYNRLSVIGVGMFGVTGTLRLESYLFLYKSNGDLLIDVIGISKPTNIDGRELQQYKFQLDNFAEVADVMAQELVNYIK